MIRVECVFRLEAADSGIHVDHTRSVMRSKVDPWLQLMEKRTKGRAQESKKLLK